MTVEKEVLNPELMALTSNQEAIMKLNMCKSPEDCYDVAKAYVPEISFDEFTEAMTLIQAYLGDNYNGLLSHEDLENVAGGANILTNEQQVQLHALGVGTGASSAAAV